MNKQEFISLIEQPEQLGKSHITALRQVVSDFPYFQAAQVLLTKALYNDHHYEFEKQLKHTSLLVPDRAVLFRYIHNLSDRQQPAAEVLPTVEKAEAPVIHLPVSPLEIPVETPASNEPERVDVSDTTLIPDTQQVTEEQPLTENPTAVAEPDFTHVPPSVEVVETAPTPVEVPPVAEVQPVAEVSSSESHSFTEWLQLQQGRKLAAVETTENPITEKTETAEAEVPAALPVEPSDKTPMETEIAEQVKRSNVNDFESILDKFIRENPRISRGKAEFYNPVNMAKQSVEENDELVTETLANVYYKQGHYKKAIRAYEKLCLIYPHKMTYFASLIQKIKTETKE